MRFYLFSPSTFTYLVSDRVLSRIEKLLSLDHGTCYCCLCSDSDCVACQNQPVKTSWDFFEHWHIRRIYFRNLFFLVFFGNVQPSDSNQYPSLLLSADYVHALLWDVPTNQFLSAFDPQMRDRSETGCVILIIDPFLPEYSL